MLVIHLPLLAIILGAIWIALHDRDHVHTLAAIIAGIIAVIWVFLLIPLPIQLLIATVILFVSQAIYLRCHKP